MTDTSVLESLLERVTKADRPSFALDTDLYVVLQHPSADYYRLRREQVPTFTASVDAALGLVEQVLPGTPWDLTSGAFAPDDYQFEFYTRDEGEWWLSADGPRAVAKSAPLAIIQCLLRALLSQKKMVEA